MKLSPSLLQELVAAAQRVYDDWEQNEDGIDLELGCGGICQGIANSLQAVLIEHHFDCTTVHSECGEQHVWVVIRHDNFYWELDIPYHRYERGSGYVWRKIPNIRFTPADILLTPSHNDWAASFQY